MGQVRERHAQFYLDAVQERPELWEWFEAEWPQIQSAWEWVSEALGTEHLVLLYCLAFHELQIRRGMWREALVWGSKGLEVARWLEERDVEAALLIQAGDSHNVLGDTLDAIKSYEEALPIVSELGDRRNEGRLLNNLGDSYYSLNETDRAAALYERALAISREVQDRGNEAIVLRNLGNACTHSGDYRRAIAYQEQAIAIDRETGDRSSEGATLGNLGIAYAHLGEFEAPSLAWRNLWPSAGRTVTFKARKPR